MGHFWLVIALLVASGCGDQRDVLVSLFHNLGGESWIYACSSDVGCTVGCCWLTASSECEWSGVVCSSSGQVETLYLPEFGLEGVLPSSIGELRSLQM
jgi:hypothetical protein